MMGSRLFNFSIFVIFLTVFGSLASAQIDSRRSSSLSSPTKRPSATSRDDLIDIDDEDEEEDEEEDDDEDVDYSEGSGLGEDDELGSGFGKGTGADEDDEDDDDDDNTEGNEDLDVVGKGVEEKKVTDVPDDEDEEDEVDEEDEDDEDEIVEEEDDDEDDGMDVDEDEEGSADLPQVKVPPPLITSKQTECIRQSKRPVAGYKPRCTETGEFFPVQCAPSTGECWCVDKNGDEVVGTVRREPAKPSCSGDAGTIDRVHEATTQQHRQRVTATTARSTDDIFVVEEDNDRRMSTSSSPKDRQHLKTTTNTLDPDVDPEYDNGHSRTRPLKDRGFFDSIRDPLILAGIIGGAVLALLCIVLLVMFTIYRMRKKDEGSYALEEPRRIYDFRYTRAKDQEYFA